MMPYGQGAREYKVAIPVAMGCNAYRVTRDAVDGTFCAVPAGVVTGFLVDAGGKVEVRTRTETGKIFWLDVDCIYPGLWEAESKLPEYRQKYGEGKDV